MELAYGWGCQTTRTADAPILLTHALRRHVRESEQHKHLFLATHPVELPLPSLLIAMEKILRGVMRYRHTTRDQMVKEFQRVRDNPHVRKRANFHSNKILLSRFLLECPYTAESRFLYLHGQSNDPHSLHGDPRRRHVRG